MKPAIKPNILMVVIGFSAIIVAIFIIHRMSNSTTTALSPSKDSNETFARNLNQSNQQPRGFSKTQDLKRNQHPKPWMHPRIPEKLQQSILNALEAAEDIADAANRKEFLNSLAAGLTSLEDVHAAMAFCESLDPSHNRNSLILAIISRWVHLNPREAASWAESQPQDLTGSRSRRLDALNQVAREWATLDPQAAMRWINTLDPQDSAHPQTELFDAWATAKPLDLAQWLSTEINDGNAGKYADAIRRLASKWSINDPNAAMAWASKLNDVAMQDQAVRITMLAWANTDSTAALTALQQTLQPDSHAARSAKAILASALTKTNPATALQLAQELTGTLRDARMLEAFKSLSISNPTGARTYYNALAESDPLRASFAPYLAATLAGDDIEAAIKALSSIGSAEIAPPGQYWQTNKDPNAPTSYEVGFRIMLETWSARDPIAALTWMANHPQYLTGRETVLNTAVAEWANHDAESAANWAASLPDDLRQNAIRAATESWAHQDLSAAINFVSNLNNPNEKSNALNAIAQKIIEQQPIVAAQLYQSHMLNLDSETVGDLAGSWGRQNPTQAANWVEQLPTGASRDAAVRNFTQSWFAISPSKASEWAAALPDPKDHQTATAVISQMQNQLR